MKTRPFQARYTIFGDFYLFIYLFIYLFRSLGTIKHNKSENKSKMKKEIIHTLISQKLLYKQTNCVTIKSTHES